MNLQDLFKAQIEALTEPVEQEEHGFWQGENEEGNERKCPECGCTEMYSTGNMAEYPEHWEKFYCTNCDFQVGLIDNSPFTHCTEWEDYIIDL